MKKLLQQYKEQLLIILTIILLGIIYFSYNLTLTWDSSEYLGLSELIGTNLMVEKWIGHRGLSFPLLLRLFKPFGIQNKIFLLILMFIFYIAMVLIIYKIYKKLKKEQFIKNKKQSFLFGFYMMFVVILNPTIFGYYHTLLTEFVSMTTTVFMCYFSWKWINLEWDKNKKQIILYGILFSLIVIFMYHVKQSLVPLAILPILIASFISVINNFKISNILSKLITIAFIIVTLLLSIKLWDLSMKDITGADNNTTDIIETTINQRVKGRLINGIKSLKYICNEETIDNIKIDENKLSEKDRKIVEDILLNKSKYKSFVIYENGNKNKYIVYFSQGDYSFKEDIIFYIKVLFNSPIDIINSYYKNYKTIIVWEKNYPIWLAKENSVIPNMIYERNIENIVDLNVDYTQYIENYRGINKTNFVSNIFNKYVSIVIRFVMVFTKFSLLILPILWISTLIIYMIINKKISKTNLSILQLIIVMYTTSFISIMSYVVFGALVDRYAIPMIIPVIIANFLLVSLLYKIDVKNKK